MTVISKLTLNNKDITKYDNSIVSNITLNNENFHFANGREIEHSICKNSVAEPIIDMQISGNSIQDGTPTLEMPIDIESVGEKTKNIVDLSKAISPSTTPHVTYNYDNKTGTIEYTNTPTQYDYLMIYLERDVGFKFELGKTYYFGAVVTVSDKQTTNETRIRFGIDTATDDYFRELQAKQNGQYVLKNSFVYDGQATIRLLIHGNIGSLEPAKVKFENVYVSEVDEFEPYGKYKIPIKVTGNNLVDYANDINIYLDEPLRKIGEYADYIDYKNKKVVRKIVARVFKGTETFNTLPSQPYPYTFYIIGGAGLVIDDLCLCTHLEHQSNFSYTREGNNKFRVFNSESNNSSRIGFRFYIDNAIVYTVNEVKALFTEYYNAGNPIVFYYAHADGLETEEPIIIPEISTFDGTTIFGIDTTIVPSDINIKYWKQIGIPQPVSEVVKEDKSVKIISSGSTVVQTNSNLTIGV